MNNRSCIRKCKKLIRHRHDSPIFYKFDKYLKITEVKIEALEEVKNIGDEGVYRVNYKFGVKWYNPFTWIVLLFVIIIYMLSAAKEVIEEIDFSLENESRIYKIK